ncbi:MAG: cytochrome b/b6 domain-containing protein [Gammaproteobacteria bacterium]|nr:cytochrome b/b6 domain-containing protein [Gammaproteobacteria bacterium]
MAEQIRRVAVWSGWLRLVHWAIAGATLVLMATGWLVAETPSVADAAADVHYLAASLLLFGLAVRLFLGFFGSGAERFEHMLPTGSEWDAIKGSALFYLTFGRAPRPNWFAHNPLWKPLYLVLLLALAASALSGWLMGDVPILGPLYLPGVHVWLAGLIGVLVLAHVYSVALQDAKGQTADISAMLNGHRYFSVDRNAPAKPEIPQVSIRLDDIRRD